MDLGKDLAIDPTSAAGGPAWGQDDRGGSRLPCRAGSSSLSCFL